MRNALSNYQIKQSRVSHLLKDDQFESLRPALANLAIIHNTTATVEHVLEVERFIRTLTERMRSVYNSLPFKLMPSRILIELVDNCKFWLNNFPKDMGISTVLSPETFVTGNQIDFAKHCKV
jgi:TPP-dependent 2-oxoacid decarboxylase